MKERHFLLFLNILLFLLAACSFARRAAPPEVEAVAGATPTATSLVRGLQPTFMVVFCWSLLLSACSSNMAVVISLSTTAMIRRPRIARRFAPRS